MCSRYINIPREELYASKERHQVQIQHLQEQGRERHQGQIQHLQEQRRERCRIEFKAYNTYNRNQYFEDQII